MNVDPRVFDPVTREALDYECFAMYPVILIACGLILLILQILENHRKQEDKENEHDEQG